jgi:hypothetical protein
MPDRRFAVSLWGYSAPHLIGFFVNRNVMDKREIVEKLGTDAFMP